MAHFADDPSLIHAFNNGLDIHGHTAQQVFAGREDLSDSEKRRRAKIINFSILYGSGPYSLGKELGVPFAEAKDYIDRFFLTYAGVRRFIDETLARAEQEPWVTTYLGRRRDIPEIQSSNRSVRENGQRMAVNTIIQGSAADLIKLAMIRIAEQLRGRGSRMLMQVHDELVFEYPPEEDAFLQGLVRREMEQVAALKVPLKVDIKAGGNWGEMTRI
jgi:DNA polymerase-1